MKNYALLLSGLLLISVFYGCDTTGNENLGQAEISVEVVTDQTGINLSQTGELTVQVLNHSDEPIFLNENSFVGYQREQDNGSYGELSTISVATDEYEIAEDGNQRIAVPFSVFNNEEGTYRLEFDICPITADCSQDEKLSAQMSQSNSFHTTNSELVTDIYTDKNEVSLSESEDIKVGIQNNSNTSIFLRSSEYVGYQRFENEEWVTVQQYLLTVDSFPDYFELEAGETLDPRGNVDGYQVFPLKYFDTLRDRGPGTYRFVYQICQDEYQCAEEDMLPLALRVSNSFRVVE